MASRLITASVGVAWGAIVLGLLPGAFHSWVAAGGGVAERRWTVGIPDSPLILLSQSGTGAFDAVQWSAVSVSVGVFSFSSLGLAAGVALLAILARRKKSTASGQGAAA